MVGRLDLRPLDRATAEPAVTLAAGADRFITNNRRDFPVDIAEISVTYPEDLPAA